MFFFFDIQCWLCIILWDHHLKMNVELLEECCLLLLLNYMLVCFVSRKKLILTFEFFSYFFQKKIWLGLAARYSVSLQTSKLRNLNLNFHLKNALFLL